MIAQLHWLRRCWSAIRRVAVRAPSWMHSGRVNQRSAAKGDFSRADVIVLLPWILVAVALVWALMRMFGEHGSADALLPVIFAVLLLMISQIASSPSDRQRKEHENRVECLLAQIKCELKKANEIRAECRSNGERICRGDGRDAG